ncbi:putative tRNA N6-adenosine threonylcarbamoyltransferase [Dictyocoela muelleri]|nr:putative tRNA N6-adenosine threonylcarbamoyltransferase [Dictyocoela muelleri]
MLTIGFESSANKLGIALTNGTTIISNHRLTFITPPGSGFRPSETASHHRSKILFLLRKVLDDSKIKLKDVDLFSFTRGPGMSQPLLVSGLVCRTLAIRYSKPIIGVNHCVAHIEMGRVVTGAFDPVVLYVSGGNTQIIGYRSDKNNDNENGDDENKRKGFKDDKIKGEDEVKDSKNGLKDEFNNKDLIKINNNTGKYVIFGETLDIAIGNCIDRVCRELKVSNDPSPGQNFEELAIKGVNYHPLPYVIKGMDISFSSIVDHVKELIKKNISKEDIAFSVQETLFSMLVEVTERALAFLNKSEILMVGGVACNKRFQEMMDIMAKERGCRLYSTDERYCIDNGAMIACTAYMMYKSGIRNKLSETSVVQRFRTDEVDVLWR